MKVLVTGITGQDGSYMCDYLLEHVQCEVIGMVRRTSNPSYNNCIHFFKNPRFTLVYGDLTDITSINEIVSKHVPDYFINFAANSFVGVSWKMPYQVYDTNTMGVIRCLESIRQYAPKCRFYSAGSSEEFGNVDFSPQDLSHPLKPRSPYGASKASARHMVKVYRESYGLYAIQSVLYNHESERRSEDFVTRKITKGVADIACGKQLTPIELGNVTSKRDWSHAKDFVRGVWMMLQQEFPREYLLSSQSTHSVMEFVENAFKCANIHGEWIGDFNDPITLKFVEKISEKELVVCVKEYFRPAEIDLLLGDSNETRNKLKWKPKYSFDDLVKSMVYSDLKKNGFEFLQ